ncbi:unnamed protein product [Nesidiocoris tenuis]|uniref:Amino acid transporter transmembrane domain-containing protein n=1 Tax=Nesidiocoris tenuis TaxID=355587 RepID=A0A6H5FUL5_9HEMI|nr:unnamed protein product [Nesidiocoris tenuis]
MKPSSSLPQVTPINRTIRHPTSYVIIALIVVVAVFPLLSVNPTVTISRYWETLVHLLKGNIGAGLFAMGDAYKNAGLIGGLFGTLVIGLICIYCSHILVWSSQHIREKLNMDSDPSFEETVEYCFEYGPKCYRKTSKLAGILVKVFIVITQLGFCCVFFVFVSDSISNVMTEYGYEIPKVCFTLAMYCVMMAVCLIPHIKFLTPISLFGTICIFVGVVVIIVLSCFGLPSFDSRQYFVSPSTWPLFFGTVVYAFEGIALIIPLRAEMRNPHNFGKPLGVFNVGMIIVMILFNLVGFIGYLRYGEQVKGSISFNLEPSVLSQCIQILVALGIAFSYPLQFFIASTVVYEAIVKKFEPCSPRKKLLVSCIVRGALVTLTCIIAIFVPHLGAFISLIGAVSSSTLALVFPVLCHVSLYTCPEDMEPAKSRLLPLFYLLDSIAMVTAALGFATGAYFSIVRLVHAFRQKV